MKEKLNYDELFKIGNLVCINDSGIRTWVEVSLEKQFEDYYTNGLFYKDNSEVFIETIIKLNRSKNKTEIIYNKKYGILNENDLQDWDFGRLGIYNACSIRYDFFLINKKLNIIFAKTENKMDLKQIINNTNDIIKNGFLNFVRVIYIDKVYSGVTGFVDCERLERKIENAKNENNLATLEVLNAHIKWRLE